MTKSREKWRLFLLFRLLRFFFHFLYQKNRGSINFNCWHCLLPGLNGVLNKEKQKSPTSSSFQELFFFPFFGGEGGQGSFHRFSLRIFSGLTYQRSHHDSSAGCLLWGQGQDKREKTTHFSESLLQVWRSSQTTCFCLYLCPQVGTLCILSKIFSCQ